MKRKYVIWAWKGDYLNLGAGCEVGFYNTYGSTKHYFFVKKYLQNQRCGTMEI